MSGSQVAVTLNQAIPEREAVPETITCDKGGECACTALDAWAVQAQVGLDCIRPGKPVENGYAESLHGRLREECLNGELSGLP